MKRILSLIITLTLVFAFFATSASTVAAEVTANDCTTSRTVIVHYHRWGDDYTNMSFWTWGNGTAGSADEVSFAGTDDFGAVGYFCVDDDAGLTAGLIPRLNDWSYKDGIDTDGADGSDNKAIPLKSDNDTPEDDTDDFFIGFDENGIKHVYVLQGSNDVYVAEEGMPFFQEEGLGTTVLVYYDPVEAYDEGWDVWTWSTGTNGTTNLDESASLGVPFQWDLGEDQSTIPDKFKVAVISTDTDAADEIGFIVRLPGWSAQTADMSIDVTAVKGSGVQFIFYILNDAQYTTYADFEAIVNLFEITDANALDRTSVEVVFNKDVVTLEDEVVMVDETNFVVTDKDGTAVAVESVSFDSTASANDTFTLILGAELSGANSPYTVTYDTDYTKEFSVDNTVPVITIIGSQNVTLELGDTYSLPTYSASDMESAEDDEASVLYNVKVKTGHGTVDTRFAGIYEVVIVATDKFGNETEEMITVTVEDPCDETAHLDANNFNAELIALLIGLPLAFGAVITLRRGY